MKKLLTFTIVFAFLLGSMAFATDTRVSTMGNVNNIVKDDHNIWIYPSTINYYPKLFTLESEPDDITQVGANFLFGADSESPWVLGTYFSTEEFVPGMFSYIGDTLFAGDQRIDLFYGRSFTDMPFGFHFGYWSDGAKNEDDDEANNYETSFTRFAFDFGLSPMEGQMDVAVGIAFTSWTEEYFSTDPDPDAVVDSTKPSGNMAFYLQGRYWMDPMGSYTLIPHAKLEYEKQGLEAYGWDGDDWALAGTLTFTDLTFDLGLGMNYDAGEDVLVITDFGFKFISNKIEIDPEGSDAVEAKSTTLVLPYFKVGIDAYVFKWMDLRCGVNSDWNRVSMEPGENLKSSTNGVETATFFGAGFHWGNFTIDAELSTEFLQNGPYFISGSNDGNNDDFTEKITLQYAF